MPLPADAPHPENALAFINFVLDPENMAGITNYVAYANAVPASLEFVDPEVKEDPQIYPSAETQEKLFSVGEVTPKYERARTRLWTRVKAGR